MLPSAFWGKYTPLRDVALRFLDAVVQRCRPSSPLAIDLLRVTAMVNLNAGRLQQATDAAERAVAQARRPAGSRTIWRFFAVCCHCSLR